MSVKEKPRRKSFSLYNVSSNETAIEQQRLGNERTLGMKLTPGGLSADGTS